MKRRKHNPGFTREAQIRGVRKALASPKTPPQLKEGLRKRLVNLLREVNVNPGRKKKLDHTAAGRGPIEEFKKRAQNPKAKRNPDSAAQLFSQFHGRGPKGVFEVQDFSDHPEVAKLGDLTELWTSFHSEDVELDWTGDGYNVAGGEVEKIEWGAGEKKPIVAAEPRGKQIYIFGAVDLGEIDSDKDLIDLGDCVLISYDTEKKFDQFQPMSYQHLFGEEDGVPPRLAYDRKQKRLFLLGGSYKIKADGIVN